MKYYYFTYEDIYIIKIHDFDVIKSRQHEINHDLIGYKMNQVIFLTYVLHICINRYVTVCRASSNSWMTCNYDLWSYFNMILYFTKILFSINKTWKLYLPN